MANESIIQVPPDVAEPLVLQRFLLRLVEKLDIVLGAREGTDSQYVAQKELLAAADELQVAIDESTATFNATIQLSSDSIESRYTELSAAILTVQQSISALEAKLAEYTVLSTPGGAFTPLALAANQALDGTVKAIWTNASDGNVTVTGTTAVFDETGTYLVSVHNHDVETGGAVPKIQLAYDGAIVGPISVGASTESTEVIASYKIDAVATKTLEVWIGNANATIGTGYTQLTTSELSIQRVA